MLNNYFSVTKFVNKLNEKIENLLNDEYKLDGKYIEIYFEGNDVNKNQYGIYVKPIFIKLNTEPTKIVKYERILEFFEIQPILTFKENKSRFVPNSKDKKNLFKLVVSLNQEEYKGFKYYPSKMQMCTNQQNCEKIRKQVMEIQKEEFISF